MFTEAAEDPADKVEGSMAEGVSIPGRRSELKIGPPHFVVGASY